MNSVEDPMTLGVDEPESRSVDDARQRLESARLELELAEAEVAAAAASAQAAAARRRLQALRAQASGVAAATHSGIPTMREGLGGDAEDVGGDAKVDVAETDVGTVDVAADTVDDSGTATPGKSTVRDRSGEVRRHAWVTVVGLTVVAAVAMIGWAVAQRIDHREFISDRDSRTDAVRAATAGVERMLSINQKSVDVDVKAILAGATGTWRSDFSQRSKDFAKVVQGAGVSTIGRVQQAGIEKPDGNGYAVLVSAESKVTNMAGAQQEPRHWRLRVTVHRDQGVDKIANMEFVP